MNDTIDIPPARSATPPGMLLHCGGETVTRDELLAVPTPEPTRTWFPLAHADLVTEVHSLLSDAGFQIDSTAHALSHEGARYFGLIQVRLPGWEAIASDYAWIVGLRNSHDKTYPAGLVAGSRVFVCDNLVRRAVQIEEAE